MTCFWHIAKKWLIVERRNLRQSVSHVLNPPNTYFHLLTIKTLHAVQKCRESAYLAEISTFALLLHILLLCENYCYLGDENNYFGVLGHEKHSGVGFEAVRSTTFPQNAKRF